MPCAQLFVAAGSWLALEALPSVLLWATGTALLLVLIAVATCLTTQRR